MLFPSNIPYNVNVDKQSDTHAQLFFCRQFYQSLLGFFLLFSVVFKVNSLFYHFSSSSLAYSSLSVSISGLLFPRAFLRLLVSPILPCSRYFRFAWRVLLALALRLRNAHPFSRALLIYQSRLPLSQSLSRSLSQSLPSLSTSVSPSHSTPTLLFTCQFLLDTGSNQHSNIFMQRAKDVTLRIIQCLISSIWVKAFYSTNIIRNDWFCRFPRFMWIDPIRYSAHLNENTGHT